MKSNINLKNTLAYNIKEGSGIISVNNLRGENERDYENQMSARQKLFRNRAKNLTAHIILSPSIEDGRRLTREDWKEITQRFLEKSGLTSFQSISFLHRDTEHFHLHIVVNRIDEDGKIYRAKNELAMSQRIADEIAHERMMIRASQIRTQKEIAQRIITPDINSERTTIVNSDNVQSETLGIRGENDSVKTEIASVIMRCHSEVLKSGGSFNDVEFLAMIESKGYTVKRHRDNTSGRLRGYGIIVNNKLYNASEIGKEYTLAKLNALSKTDNSFQGERARMKMARTDRYYTVIKPVLATNGPNSDPSAEFNREVDLGTIVSDLESLTSGHRYNGYDEFIKAIEAKGYHVHLKYEVGKLSGYVIHKGTEHYHDKEIDKGRFGFANLLTKGLFKESIVKNNLRSH